MVTKTPLLTRLAAAVKLATDESNSQIPGIRARRPGNRDAKKQKYFKSSRRMMST